MHLQDKDIYTYTKYSFKIQKSFLQEMVYLIPGKWVMLVGVLKLGKVLQNSYKTG